MNTCTSFAQHYIFHAEHIVHAGVVHDVTTEHFKIYGGGHDWPGVWGNMDFHATAEVWKFFFRPEYV